jgi:hypothetical protein
MLIEMRKAVKLLQKILIFDLNLILILHFLVAELQQPELVRILKNFYFSESL